MAELDLPRSLREAAFVGRRRGMTSRAAEATESATAAATSTEDDLLLLDEGFAVVDTPPVAAAGVSSARACGSAERRATRSLFVLPSRQQTKAHALPPERVRAG